MARGRTDADHRPNTLKENRMVLCELRSRGKIDHKTSYELDKLFAKLNCDSAPKHWKNGRAALGGKQEKTSAENAYGPVEGFPPGSWWGIRMDCSRDRVHGPFNADIQDGPAGAVSLCTSHLNTHYDEDLGDWLTFTGTSYDPAEQPDHPLVRSYQSQVPLRLVRSYNLTNEFAPKTGYRYDGLYTVAACWIGVTSAAEKHYKFALIRVRNQEPPPWKESRAASGKNFANAEKPHVPQTRCNTDRFSTNLCSETHPNANERDTASSSRCRSESTKFSFDKSANIADKATPECKRKTHDSAIVTRCISVKKAECPSSSGASLVPYGESLVQSAHRVHENASKPTPCKLQNTNISIRTDLYDSSHNIQHDTKKTIPMTFCRTFGPARNTRVVNHSHVGTLNLNSCGPCPRDGEQESLIQSRSGVGKMSTTESPCSESDRSVDRSTPKVRLGDSPNEVKSRLGTIETRITDVADDNDAPDCAKVERSEQELRDRTVCPITRTSSEKNTDAPETDRDETREEISRDHRTALDSLTPDQMLKYIAKRKYHPTAKLLIGSVIGLATGESKILRTYDSLMSRNESWSRSKKLRADKSDSPAGGKVEKELDRRRAASNKSMKKERSIGKSATQKRSTKERIFTMRLRRTRVSKRLLVSEKKSGAKNSENSSERPTKSKVSEKVQQPFSKSTSPKNSKRSAKKRRSELANLAIDANIGPKIRGLRNRRLRGRSYIFAKKRRDVDIPSCCGGESRSDVGARGKKGNSRVELTSKRSKRLTSAGKTRAPQSRFAGHKKRVQKTETTNVERKIKNSGNSDARRNLAGSTRKAEKRKVPRNQSRGRERVSGDGGDDASKRLRRCAEKEASTIRRTITMVDAATQCSNSRDAATSVDDDVERPSASDEPESPVKVEWIDLDDVKSESCESDEEQFVLELASERYGSCETEANREDADVRRKPRETLPIRPQPEKPQIVNVAQRLSAFVPVNISDSDFRIARLRSIGFRPIEPAFFRRDEDQCAGGSSKDTSESTVMSRVADEQYNKYTSEETTVVGYMDQELRYQDVEEDVLTVVRDRMNPNVGGKTGNRVTRVRAKKLNIAGGVKVETTRRVSTSLEDDSEIPWHGWKKFVKNKQAHWIGW